jgi:RNA polymerase sigma-70 factor (ECF subfamily)
VTIIQSKLLKKTFLESSRLDFKYVKGIRSNDPAAFASLFRKYYEQLFYFALRFLKDSQTAENIVQDVFVKLWEKREEWHVQSSVKAYLYTAVKNRSLNYIKREKSMVSVEEVSVNQMDEIPSPEESLIENEIMEAVQGAIEKLPQQCRCVYQMKRYDGMTYSEIAEILNVSINTVKTQMKRALKSLHKNLAYLYSLLWIF